MSLFSRFDISPGRHRPRTLRNGAAFVGVLVLLLFMGYTRSVPLLPQGGKIVRAEFVDATNVRAGTTSVRIRGVEVGKVESVQAVGRGSDRRAVVRMRIASADADALRRDAHAAIYWRTLLGRNMYVELDPGSSPNRLDGRAIPVSRTETQVELDKALEPLDGGGRAAVQQFSDTLDEGLVDAAPVQSTIDRLDPAMRVVAPTARALRGQGTGDLLRAVRGLRSVARSLDRDERRLGDLIDSGAVTLGVTAARRADMASTLRLAPGTLDVTHARMVRLRATLDRVDVLTDELGPGARRVDETSKAVTPALDKLRPVLQDARPLLDDLQPGVRALRAAAQEGLPLVSQLEPTVKRLKEQIVPWFISRGETTGRRVYELIGPTAASLDSYSSHYDANGHDIAFQSGTGARFAEGFVPCSAYLTDPKSSERIRCDGFLDGLNQLLGGTSASAGKTGTATGANTGRSARSRTGGDAAVRRAPRRESAPVVQARVPASLDGRPSKTRRARTAVGSAMGSYWTKALNALREER
jgi:virulence factor Mce-like protein